jgi:hypothetical protein
MFTDTVATQGLSTAAAKVTEKTILIVVRKGRFNTKRQASLAAVDVETDKSLVTLSKRILDSPELRAVQRHDSATTNYLRSLCLKSMFKGGVYVIPLGLVEEVNATLEARTADRLQLVDAAVATYEMRSAETSARLDVLDDPSDYPSTERFRASFYYEWQFVTFETPSKLKEIRPELFEIERQKAAAKLSAVADECRDALRLGMADLVAHMVDRLTPDASGKPKKFGKTIVQNFNEFFRTFELRNVTDDHELATLVTQAKAVLSGVDRDMLKKDEALRLATAAQFTALKAQLEPMTVTRAIDLDDEDDDA